MLARIERANLVLAVLLTALAGVLWGARGAIAAGAGAALACADFWLLAAYRRAPGRAAPVTATRRAACRSC